MEHVITPDRSENLSRQQWMRIGILSTVVLVVGALVGSAMTAKGWSPFRSGGNPPLVLSENQNRVNQAITLNSGFSAVAKAVTPAVVVVTTSGRPQATQNPFFGPLEDFFNRPNDQQDDDGLPRRRVPQQQQPKANPNKKTPLVPTGTGSGVIVSQDGYIITNNHVVEGAEKVEISLSDKRTFTAKVIGTDAPSDVAVLKIDASGLPTLPIGNSDQVEVGDIVLAVGNPLGIGQTVTMGIISAKGRSTTAGVDRRSYEDFLQTDAAINRGNSGGALVNLKGELVGIPSQILSPSGGSIGIGFAIPTNMARKVMEQLIATGKVKRGMLGVIIGPIDPDVAEQFGYKGDGGVMVREVQPGLAADKAGIKHGDIILEFEGHKISDSNEFRNLVANLSPGSEVRLKLFRDGTDKTVTAKLVDATDQTTVAKNGNSGNDKAGAGVGEGVLSGIRVENMSSELSQRFKLIGVNRGVVVVGVDDESNAAGRLRVGDVIQEVNRQPVNNVSEFDAAVKRAGNKKVVLYVQLQRGGTLRSDFVTISPQE